MVQHLLKCVSDLCSCSMLLTSDWSLENETSNGWNCHPLAIADIVLENWKLLELKWNSQC